jgi:hypothetical protein
MRSRLNGTCVALGILLLSLAAGAGAAQKRRPWQTGRLLSVSASGYGKTDRRRKDLWWKYCIQSGSQAYAVASRQSPKRMGLAVGEPVRFALEGNRLYVLDKDGREQVMHLQNRDTESDCNPKPPADPAPPHA